MIITQRKGTFELVVELVLDWKRLKIHLQMETLQEPHRQRHSWFHHLRTCSLQVVVLPVQMQVEIQKLRFRQRCFRRFLQRHLLAATAKLHQRLKQETLEMWLQMLSRRQKCFRRLQNRFLQCWELVGQNQQMEAVSLQTWKHRKLDWLQSLLHRMLSFLQKRSLRRILRTPDFVEPIDQIQPQIEIHPQKLNPFQLRLELLQMRTEETSQKRHSSRKLLETRNRN